MNEHREPAIDPRDSELRVFDATYEITNRDGTRWQYETNNVRNFHRRNREEWDRIVNGALGAEASRWRRHYQNNVTGGTQTGDLRHVQFVADGHRTVLRIERDVMEHGRLAHPSRDDATHYGRHTPDGVAHTP